MIVGLLSDSHGRHAATRHALRLLQDRGAEAFVHCGDLGSKHVLEQLAGLRAWFVWGNTDDPSPSLEDYARALGLPVPGQVPLRIELSGRRLAVFHGHEPTYTHWLHTLEPGVPTGTHGPLADCDYLLHGHTHVARDRQIGRARVINPGALFRASVHTVATLDLRRDLVEFWEVGDAGESAEPRRFRPA